MKQPEMTKCACGNEYFEQVKVSQYPTEQRFSHGGGVDARQDKMPYYVLRCIFCGKVRPPDTIRGFVDRRLDEEYDRFLDKLEGIKSNEV